MQHVYLRWDACMYIMYWHKEDTTNPSNPVYFCFVQVSVMYIHTKAHLSHACESSKWQHCPLWQYCVYWTKVGIQLLWLILQHLALPVRKQTWSRQKSGRLTVVGNWNRAPSLSCQWSDHATTCTTTRQPLALTHPLHVLYWWYWM